MFRKINLIYLPAILLTLNTCNNNPVKPDDNFNGEISLSVEDVSCTEAWLKLNVKNINKPVNVEVKRDDSTIFSFTNITSELDTILIDEGLLPDKSYSYNAMMKTSAQTIEGDKVTANTMDTTSHNFTWQTFTFGGDAGSSTLYDVAIIDENNIWAVGAIYLKDSLGNPDPNAYNVVHWDGTEWELHRILFYTVCGQQSRTSYPAKSIFAFDKNEIWISMFGDQLAKIENGVQTETICSPRSFTINKIWGTSSNDLYIVGNNGNIAHYNGTSWKKIESGTNLNINDIYGAFNQERNVYEILAPASNVLKSFDRTLLKIEGSNVNHLSTEPIQYTLSSIWFIPGRTYFLGGAGIYKKRILDETGWKYKYSDITSYYTNKIRGDNINNIVAVGGVGEVIHFNGANWRSFIDETRLDNGNYYSAAISDNIIVAVGENAPKASIIMGKRVN